MHKQATVNKIYDPAAGSGSLLLQAKKQFEDRIIEDGFFGQEINHTTYNLARMNMFLHNIITISLTLHSEIRLPTLNLEMTSLLMPLFPILPIR